MDQLSAQRLADLLQMEPAALEAADIAFLRARQSYLSKDEKEKYADLLADEPASGYADLKLDKLREIATERGVEFEASAKKADLIALLEAADAAQ